MVSDEGSVRERKFVMREGQRMWSTSVAFTISFCVVLHESLYPETLLWMLFPVTYGCEPLFSDDELVSPAREPALPCSTARTYILVQDDVSWHDVVYGLPV